VCCGNRFRTINSSAAGVVEMDIAEYKRLYGGTRRRHRGGIPLVPNSGSVRGVSKGPMKAQWDGTARFTKNIANEPLPHADYHDHPDNERGHGQNQ
jgi:hypothetical protein